MLIRDEGDGNGADPPKWANHSEHYVFWMLNPRGIDQPWTRKSPPNYVERALALLGRTADEGRVWDISAVAHALETIQLKADNVVEGKRELRIIARGQAGVLAAYAALFEPSIKEVVIIDPPKSHMEGPILLNVLRILDIPDALGLLAPNVSLTLINAKDKAFDRTAAIYKLAGAEGKLKRK